MAFSISSLPIFNGLGSSDKGRLAGVSCSFKVVDRHSYMSSLVEGEEFAFFLRSGWVACYRIRRNGSRRVTEFMLPGDISIIPAIAGMQRNNAMLALTQCSIGFVPHAELENLMVSSPNIRKAIYRAMVVGEETVRVWLTNSQDAAQSFAHLLCELHARYTHLGALETNRFPVPMSQEVLGDALGITAVHANRILKQLRLAGLVDCKRGFAQIQDVQRLREFCGFNPKYLTIPL